MNDDLSRRGFIASTAAFSAAAALPSAAAAAAAPAAAATSTSLIHLFLPGGWPCNDLWDPKPFTPFRAGMRGSDLTSTVETITTNVSSIKLGAPLGHTSQYMDRGTIIRSLVDDAKTTDHATAQANMLDALSFGHEITEVAPDLTQSDGLAQALLEATRLTAKGHRQVRVTLPFEAYQGFDAHEDGASKPRRLMKTVDMVIAAIVHQLEATGQLDRTTFCISSEFNRTIAGCPAAGCEHHTGENLKIEMQRDYGFHAHFAQANSVVLFGGRFKRGFVFGRTAPKHPMRVVENPVTLANLHATLAVAMGAEPRMGQAIREVLV